MQQMVVIGWCGYVGLAFVLRSVWAWRETGSTGFVGLRRGAGALERAAGAGMVLAFAVSVLAPFVGEPLFDARWAGPLVVLAATLGTLWAQLVMGPSWRIGVRDGEQTELVTRAPFTLVRNPIFTAMIAASAGMALTCPTPLAMLAPCLLALSLEVQVRRVEEPHLISVHGETYRAYASRVGRFVPGIGCL